MSKAVTPKIAIIGAGSAGLAAARVFSRNGIPPIILEKDTCSGGVWHYEPGSKHRPMYRNLRTNLPKEIMRFREFPFPSSWPSFLTHDKVQQYLLTYQKEFDLTKLIRYGCEVSKLEILPGKKSLVSPTSEEWPKIRLEWVTANDATTKHTDVYDAVLVCNGHYAKPSTPKVPGLQENYTGKVIHSVEYDDPADFIGQSVLCVGGRASGSDIAREISPFASHVYLSDSSCQLKEGQPPDTQNNVTWLPLTSSIRSDGSIQFENCPSVSPKVDCIIFCTGYDYDFPFLQDNEDILQFAPGERRVTPLWEQLWHPRYPTLTFPGIPHSVVPFPEVEFQTEAIYAQYFDTKYYQLPSLEDRIAQAKKDAQSGGSKEGGRVPHDTHYLGAAQWDYCRRLAKLAGVFSQEVDDYIATNQAIYEHSWEGRKMKFPAGPDTYREVNYQRDDVHRSFSLVAPETS